MVQGQACDLNSSSLEGNAFCLMIGSGKAGAVCCSELKDMCPRNLTRTVVEKPGKL